MEQRKYQVTGMTCAHCEMSVREEVEQIAGVEGIEVSATTGKLVLNLSRPIEDAAVFSAVEEAGYQAERA